MYYQKQRIMDWIYVSWPWYVAGPLLALTMFFLLVLGGNLGLSANLRTLCTIAGANKYADFFKIDYKAYRWNLIFVLGAIIGGFLSAQLLSNTQPIDLNPDTIEALATLGFSAPTTNHLPPEIFGSSNFVSFKGALLLIVGGFLVGFGARYAGGCTSGHAISGLSNLQIPSLIAVAGFFIGGMSMTHLLFPILF